MLGSTIGVIKGDARSLDYSSCMVRCLEDPVLSAVGNFQGAKTDIGWFQ